MANPRHPDDSDPLDFDLDLDEIGPEDAGAPSPSDGEGAPRASASAAAPLPSRRDDLDELEGGDAARAAESAQEASDAFLEETVEVVFDDDEEEGYLEDAPDSGAGPEAATGTGDPGGELPPVPELPELDPDPAPVAAIPRGFPPPPAASRNAEPLPDLEDLEDLDDVAPPEEADPDPGKTASAPAALEIPDDLEPLDTPPAISPPVPGEATPPSPAPPSTPLRADTLDDLDDLEGLEYQTEAPALASAPGAPQAENPGIPDELGAPGADGEGGGKVPGARKLVPLEWASLGLVAVLVLTGLILFQRSVRRDPSSEEAGKPSTAVPGQLDGSLFKLGGIKAYWRERRDTDRVDRESILLPELSLEIASGSSGYLQALFQDETGSLRGDSVTRRAANGTFDSGETIAKFLGTEGFINESFFAGYQMEGADAAWSITLRESADNSTWSELATFHIPAVRETP